MNEHRYALIQTIVAAALIAPLIWAGLILLTAMARP